MKKIVYLLVFLMGSLSVFGQSGKVECTSYKEINKIKGTWQNWPTNWTLFENVKLQNPVVRIKRLATNPYVYEIRYYVGNDLKASMNVLFNSTTSAQTRKDWNYNVVNCYNDDEGNAITARGCSLDELALNPQLWNTLENSQLIIYTGNHALAVK